MKMNATLLPILKVLHSVLCFPEWIFLETNYKALIGSLTHKVQLDKTFFKKM